MRWLFLTSLVLLGACGGGERRENPLSFCKPGATRACEEGGYVGTQTCSGSGSAWGACVCSPGGGPGSVGECSDCLHTPQDPTAPIPADQAVTFAVNRIYFGDTARDSDVSDPDAWRKFGYDIDGRNTRRGAPDHCLSATRVCAAEDGPAGIDNGFGRSVIPLLLDVGVAPGETNQQLAAGETTLIIHNENLSAGANQSGVRAQLYTGAALGKTPAFDGSDIWPVSAGSLKVATDIDSSRVAFPNAFVADGVWVSGTTSSPVTVELTLSNGIRLRIHHAIVTANISDPSSIVEGVIAGVLDTEEFVEEGRQFAGRLDSALCSGSAWEGVAQQIRAVSDIRADGSNGAGALCDGISIGLGFDARPIIRGAITPAEAPPPAACD